MRKTLITIIGIIVALPFVMQANGAAAPFSTMAANANSATHKTQRTGSNAFDGAYIGVGLGETSLTYKFRSDDNVDFGNDGVDASAFAGYGITLNNALYLGGELFGSYNNSNDHIDTLTVKNKYRYGVNARAGYLMSNKTMVYGALGSSYSKFSFYQDGEKFFTKNRVGLIPGVGIETAIKHNVLLRAQYTNTLYKNFKFGDDTKVIPHRGTFTLGISYLFA